MPATGIITLLSDMGTRDPYPAILKGVILKHNPALHIVDISHEVRKFDVEQAGYMLQTTLPYFPAETIHLAAIDVNCYNNNNVLVVRTHKQWLICGNNGLISFVNEQPEVVYSVPAPSGASVFNALHWLVPVALKLADTGNPSAWASVSKNYDTSLKMQPAFYENGARANVMYIDDFENIVLNITRPDFERIAKGRAFRVVLGRENLEDGFSPAYEDVRPGETLVYFNAAGYLEIAMNKGNAGGLLNVKLRDSIHIEFI